MLLVEKYNTVHMGFLKISILFPSRISSKGIFQVLLALIKIINDTKEIISTSAMKLSPDPDAQNLKLICGSTHCRQLMHPAPLPFPPGTQPLRGAVIHGKCRLRHCLFFVNTCMCLQEMSERKQARCSTRKQ